MSQFEYGLVVLVIGMTVVMAALISLSLIMVLMEAIFYKDPNKKKKIEQEMKQPAMTTKESKPVAKPSIKKDEEIVAVISAAIAAYTSQENWNISVEQNQKIVAAISAAIAVYTDQKFHDFNIISLRRVAAKSEWLETGKPKMFQTQPRKQKWLSLNG